LIKKGENGKGICSRWYPKTLQNRILAINFIKQLIIVNIAGLSSVITMNSVRQKKIKKS